jgi:hypothetical protein
MGEDELFLTRVGIRRITPGRAHRLRRGEAEGTPAGDRNPQTYTLLVTATSGGLWHAKHSTLTAH